MMLCGETAISLKVTNAIKKFKVNGFVVSVMTTLTKNNMELIPDLIRLLGKLGVDYFALERFMPEGQGGSNADWTLSKEETRRIFEYMTEQALQVKGPHL